MAAAEPVDLVQAVLDAIVADDTVEDSRSIARRYGVDHQEQVVGAIKKLESAEYVVTEKRSLDELEATAEGKAIIAEGKSPEIRLFELLTPEGVETDKLKQQLGQAVIKIGMGPNMKNKWAKKNGTLICRMADPATVQDTAFLLLKSLSAGEQLAKADGDALAKRKLVVKRKVTFFTIRKGTAFAPQFKKQEADITVAMMQSKEWKSQSLKPYNFEAMGVPVGGGYFHPLLKVRAEFRRILMQMGFEEMPTSRWVESSFWNFDSLFQPQSHPARDAHDTFFIKNPAEAVRVPEDYYERVKEMHQVGGHGSIGYRYDFKREEAFKNLLRTHTTAVSSRMLYQLANQPGGFKPKKYFSIDRVFRNEDMDKTHLCEFHQVEGLVADYDLSLKDLIGQIKTFFEAIGITQLRFKPAFNPYTEPSMEVFGFHPDLGKWTEIGNSGIFRPEMLAPMGLPPNVRVIAWGLSLERPTMIKYRISNIRDLFGHQTDVNQTKNAPLARFP